MKTQIKMIPDYITQILFYGDLKYNLMENWKLIVTIGVFVATLHQIVRFLQIKTSNIHSLIQR